MVKQLVTAISLFSFFAFAFNASASSSDVEQVPEMFQTPQTLLSQGLEVQGRQDRDVLARTNAFRARTGNEPLTLDPELTAVAQRYAQRMATEGFFSHFDPQGRGLEQRYRQGGLRWLNAGENIARGYGSGSDAVRGWIESPGHRANLASPKFSRLGVGFYRGFWVQNFAD